MTFGDYKGHSVYLMHMVKHEETNEYKFPYLCRLKLPISYEYLEFLQRKVTDGFKSMSLRILVEDIDDNIWVRNRRTRRYQIEKGRLEKILDRFKLRFRYRLAMKKIRIQYKNRLLHEETRIQYLIDKRYDLDHILES